MRYNEPPPNCKRKEGYERSILCTCVPDWIFRDAITATITLFLTNSGGITFLTPHGVRVFLIRKEPHMVPLPIRPEVIRAASRLVARNLPRALAVAASGGVVATAVLAAKAHTEASVIPYETGDTHVETVRNFMMARWRPYAPAVLAAAATIACIVGSHRIMSMKLAGMTASYGLAKASYDRLKDSVLENSPVKQQEKIFSGSVPTPPDLVYPQPSLSSNSVLCYDEYTGRYFASNREAIRAAVNDVNEVIYQQDYCPLNRFYEALGLEPVTLGDNLVWDQANKCSVLFGSGLDRDGRPCLTYAFVDNPFAGWR